MIAAGGYKRESGMQAVQLGEAGEAPAIPTGCSQWACCVHHAPPARPACTCPYTRPPPVTPRTLRCTDPLIPAHPCTRNPAPLHPQATPPWWPMAATSWPTQTCPCASAWTRRSTPVRPGPAKRPAARRTLQPGHARRWTWACIFLAYPLPRPAVGADHRDTFYTFEDVGVRKTAGAALQGMRGVQAGCLS